MLLGQAIQSPGIIERLVASTAAQDDTLVIWLKDAVSAGALAVPDPALAAELFWAMAGGALFWPAVVTPSSVDRHKRDRLMDELVATFLARYRKA